MKRFFIWLLLVVMTTVGLLAATKKRFNFGSMGGYSLSKTATSVPWALRFHQGYNMQVWLTNKMTLGCQALDLACGGIGPDGRTFFGLEYPQGTGIEHLYGGGPWFGGIINGTRHVSEGYNGDDARNEFIPKLADSLRDRMWIASVSDSLLDKNFTPPRVLAHSVGRRGIDDDGDGKVDEDELDGLDNDSDWVALTDDVGADGLPDSLENSCNGRPYDAVTNPDPAFDNYAPSKLDSCHRDIYGRYPRRNNPDKYTEKNGIPDHGEPHVDEDFATFSDQDVYAAATDNWGASPNVPGHQPMNVKVFQKSYAWAGDFADGILPFDYLYINNGQNAIKDVYVGFFADMDVGPYNANVAGNNYAEYRSNLRLGFIQNPVDHGSTPLGITVLAAPRPLDSIKYVWQWHGFTDPGTDDTLIYSNMSGEHFGSDPHSYVCGNCIKASQSPDDPTDTRFFFSFGPFNGKDGNGLKKGDTLKVTLAFISGYSVDKGPNKNNQNDLITNTLKAIRLYAKGFVPPVQPPPPCVKVDTGFRRVTIRWGPQQVPCSKGNPYTMWDDSNKIAGSSDTSGWRRKNPPSGHTSGGRIFEGYRLYRSEDPFGTRNSFTLIRQWDLPDEFEYNFPYDDSTLTDTIGQGLNLKIQTAFIDSNLMRGKTYWYAVTSFGIPDQTIFQTKDSAGNVRYDTLFSENTESGIGESMVRIELPFDKSNRVGDVLVVPNPYRVDQDYSAENGGWEGSARRWDESKRLVRFIHLPEQATVRIFTLTGDLVTTLNNFNSSKPGEIEWRLMSESGRAIASGVYIFTVESDKPGLGGKQIGKFVLIR